MTLYLSKKIVRLLTMVFFIHVSSHALSQKTDSLKCWSKTNKLKWCDFKGKIPDEKERSFLTASSALRLIPIRTVKEGVLSYKIKLVFRKYQSWTTDTAKYLLSHEQLHFDISELYARKLRKAIQAIAETHPNPTEDVFKVVIQKLYLENASMQTNYDEDTIHGIDGGAQIKWRKRIKLELEKLEKYTSADADCRQK